MSFQKIYLIREKVSIRFSLHGTEQQEKIKGIKKQSDFKSVFHMHIKNGKYCENSVRLFIGVGKLHLCGKKEV